MTSIKSRPPSAPGAADHVEMVLAQLDALPTLPAIAVRLLEITSNSRSNAREVISLVENDPSVSARLLALARRAEIAADVNTVDRAVVLLGFEAVRSLVLSVQVFETFSQRIEHVTSRLDTVGLWRHSLAVACAARLLAAFSQAGPGDGSQAKEAQPVKPEDVFVCGLLHDLGKVALNACFPKSYDRVVAAVDTTRGCIADQERKVFGIDHTLAGRRLATHWKLPNMVQETIWLHHHSPASTPTRIEHPRHVQLVQLADRLARHLRIGYSGHHESDGPIEVFAAAMGINREVLDRVTSALPELIEARAEIIGLDRVTSKELYYNSLVDANSELARVNSAVADSNRRLEQRSRAFEALLKLTRQMGEQPALEEVLCAAVEAGESLSHGRRVAVLAWSPTRSVVGLATADAQHGTRAVLLPLSELPEMNVPIASTGWLSATLIPPLLRDRIAAALPQPAWWFPIAGHDLAGFWVIGGEGRPESDMEGAFAALSDVARQWLQAAETTAAARQLSEELAEINRRLIASQEEVARMRSVSMVAEMAAGAAHEMNNPLAVISGRAQMLNREGASEEVRKSAGLISEHANRASQIVTELMEFAKPSPPQPTNWSLGDLLRELRNEWIERNALTAEQFQLEISDELPPVRADASQIRTLFDEVIRNAVEAMRESSPPGIIVNCRHDLADDRLVVRIKDNGCGMSPDVLGRAMDPFFSHRPAGRGRGLGLSRAARYAQINGGRIRLNSQPGEGTAVLVELPCGS
jgi:putative nucleotidyltransferase with HDIG domain